VPAGAVASRRHRALALDPLARRPLARRPPAAVPAGAARDRRRRESGVVAGRKRPGPADRPSRRISGPGGTIAYRVRASFLAAAAARTMHARPIRYKCVSATPVAARRVCFVPFTFTGIVTGFGLGAARHTSP